MARTTLAVLACLACVYFSTDAAAEITLFKAEDDWELFSSGRFGGFVQYVNGDGFPQPQLDENGIQIHSVSEGGYDFVAERQLNPDGSATQGKIEGSRVRSGFLGNILKIGVRRPMDANTTVSGLIAIWSVIESENRRKYLEEPADIREGYVKVEGLFGSVLVGRSLTLFSRGTTDIDFLYGHRYGVGNPAGFDSHGPAGGHIGYGVLANGFAAGVVYATPSLAGLQLSAGYYDPSKLNGLFWERTKWGRPEAELTYDLSSGDFLNLHLFVNGGWQKVYEANGSKSAAIWGAAAGGRVELGPVHLGSAVHQGVGLGLNYAFDGSNASVALQHDAKLRTFDGLYVQSQFVINKHFDLSAGWGITRVHLLPEDQIADPTTGYVPISIVKHQVGYSAGAFYHFSDHLHLGVDYFRSDIRWWLREHQVVNTYNAGLTLTW